MERRCELEFLNLVNSNMQLVSFDSFEDFCTYMRDKNQKKEQVTSQLNYYYEYGIVRKADLIDCILELKKAAEEMDGWAKTRVYSQELAIKKRIRLSELKSKEDVSTMIDADMRRLASMVSFENEEFIALFERAGAEWEKQSSGRTVIETNPSLMASLVRRISGSV